MTPELAKVLNEAAVPDFSPELLEEARLAASVVASYMGPSPLRKSRWLSELTGGEVFLKLECLNPNGSFKVRGALNAIKQRTSKGQKIKVCAASAGNHAQGIAFAAKQMGVEAHIFLPKRTPMVKRAQTEHLGAHVYMEGNFLEEAFEAAIAFGKKENAQFIHAFNDKDIILGQASLAFEVLADLKTIYGKDVPIDEFICSVGGGGLIAGAGFVFKSLQPNIQVTGVEQEFFDSAYQSMENKKQSDVSVTGKSTIADGIAVRRIGNVTFEFIKKFMDKAVLVTDEDIVAAVLGLCENEHVVSEGAGATGVAHILKNPSLFSGKRVVIPVSGGNIDPQLLTRVIARGLNVTGRMLRLTARIGDRPGQLKTFLEEIAQCEANVIEVYHDRAYTQVNVGDVEVNVVLETRDSEHQYEIIGQLNEKGFMPKIWHS